MVARRRLPPRAEPMLLTERDQRIVHWIHGAELATREHVQQLFFRHGSRSLCQRRLTLLYRNRYIEKLPNRALSAPDVYRVSRHCTNGVRLLRAMIPEEPLQLGQVKARTVEHTLDIASFRIAVIRACERAGFQLLHWRSAAELARMMGTAGVIPDAYLQIERPTPDGPRRSSFFVEIQRSAQSQQALEEKCRRYGAYYYGGEYARAFGTRALRVLVAIGSDYGINPDRQIRRLLNVCTRLQVTFVMAAGLDGLKRLAPPDVLTEPVWHSHAHEGQSLTALFPS